MSDETMEQRVVRAKGMCGGLNADGSSICIRNPGHTGDCFPSEEIERASAVLVGHPGLQAWEPVILARAILEASGLIADRDKWKERAKKAQLEVRQINELALARQAFLMAEVASASAERDEARKLLDELYEIVGTRGGYTKVLTLDAIEVLLREHYASRPGWK